MGTISSATTTATSVSELEWLRNLPKVEIHLHLEGTVTPATLVVLSQRHDANPLTLAQAEALYEYSDFAHFLIAFGHVCQRLRTVEDYELIVSHMIRDLAAQGIVHAEVYISISGLLSTRSHLDVGDVFAAIERAREAAERVYPTSVSWIVDATRQAGVEACSRVFSLAARYQKVYPRIVGVGIGGDESAAHCGIFRHVYAQARRDGLHLTAHAGESTGVVDGPKNIWEAIEIGSERIGHGTCAVHDERLLQFLKHERIPVEVCITSNLKTGVIADLASHPLVKMLDAGVAVTINSDDPAMFASDLLREYVSLRERLGLSRGQVKELAKNGVRASFLPSAKKAALLESIDFYPI